MCRMYSNAPYVAIAACDQLFRTFLVFNERKNCMIVKFIMLTNCVEDWRYDRPLILFEVFDCLWLPLREDMDILTPELRLLANHHL